MRENPGNGNRDVPVAKPMSSTSVLLLVIYVVVISNRGEVKMFTCGFCFLDLVHLIGHIAFIPFSGQFQLPLVAI